MGRRLFPPGRFDIGVDSPSRLTQREFAQGRQVGLLKEALDRSLSLLGDVDLAPFESPQQFFRCDVHQFEIVGQVEHPVGDCLPHGDAGNLSDHIVEAFDVLDIERRPDINPGFEQLFNILPALFVTTSVSVRVGEFIHKEQVGTASQGRIDRKLPQSDAAIRGFSQGECFEPGQQGLRLHPSVWFDIPDDDIPSLAFRSLGVLQHQVRLADSRSIPKEHLERTTPGVGFLGLHLSEKFIGIGAGVCHVLNQLLLR